MEETFFGKITNFLHNNFELFITIEGSLIIFFIVLYVAVRLHFISVRKLLHSVLRGFLLTTIIFGQIILVVLIGYVYWQNYHKPAPELQFSTKINASTRWVKSNLRIYFIEGNILRSIRVTGTDREDVFTADAPIKEYHFSPDGAHLLVLTQNSLHWVNRLTKEDLLIDRLKSNELLQPRKEDNSAAKGSIGGIQWSPDSQKFIYEVARWSQYSTQDNVYIYTLSNNRKKSIRSPTRRISSLYWGVEGDNLYYLHHEVQSESLYSTAFEVKVFRISLSTLTPELVAKIPFEESSVPIANLNLRNIDLYLDGDQFSFGRGDQEDFMVSPEGPLVGIDENDFMYYKAKRWFRKRLFKIPREASESDIQRYQYKGGDLVVDHIRWIPGGRYVIMEHKYWGVILLEPSTGRFGILIEANGNTFGWYQQK